MKPIHRALSTLAFVVGFGFVSLVMHEFFHFVMLRAFGGDGYITYSLTLGFNHFTVTPDHVWAVELSGGLLTAVFFLSAFWIWPSISDSPNDTNLEVASFTSAIGNLAYGPTEMFTSSEPIGVAAFGIGFAAAAVLYFFKLAKWIEARKEERWTHENG